MAVHSQPDGEESQSDIVDSQDILQYKQHLHLRRPSHHSKNQEASGREQDRKYFIMADFAGLDNVPNRASNQTGLQFEAEAGYQDCLLQRAPGELYQSRNQNQQEKKLSMTFWAVKTTRKRITLLHLALMSS